MRVEKNVPIPEYQGKGWPSVYPWDDMDVGDSFLVQDGKINVVSSAANWRSRTKGGRYICRTVDGVGVRVWRVE